VLAVSVRSAEPEARRSGDPLDTPLADAARLDDSSGDTVAEPDGERLESGVALTPADRETDAVADALPDGRGDLDSVESIEGEGDVVAAQLLDPVLE